MGAEFKSGMAAPLRLRVRDHQGRVRVIALAGMTPQAAQRHARTCGMQVLALETAETAARSGARFPLLLFNQELLALLEAGLNLGEVLNALHGKARPGEGRDVLAGLLQALAEGGRLADAMTAWPLAFPAMYVATVRASEQSGDLARALERYGAYQGQMEVIRKKLVAATVYPAVLLSVGLLVSLFLLGYVVPRFAVLYDASGQTISGATAWLLRLGLLLHAHGRLSLLLLVVLVGAAAMAVCRPATRVWLRERLLALPGVRGPCAAFRLARFYRALSLLLASGIALPRAMGMAADLLGPTAQPALARCRLALEQGQRLSAALLAAGLAGPVSHSLVQVGERSGQLAQMLERSARFADDDFTRRLDWASRLAEPLLMLLIGGLVGGLVVLMYLPVFELAGSMP